MYFSIFIEQETNGGNAKDKKNLYAKESVSLGIAENENKYRVNYEKNCDANNAEVEKIEVVNDFTRDKSKWKFSKEELLERRKKMLKEKKSIKK